MTPAVRNTWVGRILVEELARLDTPLVCLAPGARCAPLSMALGATDRVPWTTFVDERAAAFHAVGVGRATGRPAVVVTTSGTAVGNLVPAAMEADRAGVPVLFLTADRPAELRNTASNQTVRQHDILAPLTRTQVDLPCSDPALPLEAVLSTLDEAAHAAVRGRGPVHVNLQFREPLGPADAPVPDAIAGWWNDAARAPWTRTYLPAPAASPTSVERLRAASRSPRGLVVVGALPHGARHAVASIVETLRWPVYSSADAGVPSGLGLDSALSDPELAARLAPDVVLWLGGGVVSKRVVTWLRALDTQLLSVTDHGARVDPAFRVRERHTVDYGQLAEQLEPGTPDPAWATSWQQLHQAATGAVQAALTDWSELSAARAVLAASGSVFLGASLPIRLADWMGSGERAVHMAANRGASGIDGVLATAAGWARHVEGPRRVLLGDLTCLHDQGSLPLIPAVGMQAVVFNNGGGSIFGMLPFGAVQGFDTVFRNHHTTRIAPLAQAHGLRTASVDSTAGLQAALADAVDLIEAHFAHDATMASLRALHHGTCERLRASWDRS
jgi:2-succinyl-5-enolpyruvyl-6-hydroxy-3-cyclohexene-1-carboxylate synthase